LRVQATQTRLLNQRTGAHGWQQHGVVKRHFASVGGDAPRKRVNRANHRVRLKVNKARITLGEQAGESWQAAAGIKDRHFSLDTLFLEPPGEQHRPLIGGWRAAGGRSGHIDDQIAALKGLQALLEVIELVGHISRRKQLLC